MFELICLVIIIALIYLFVVYVLPLILGGLAIIYFMVLVIAAVSGSGFALVNYWKSIEANMNFREWTWEKDDEPAKRSYFFGPGYRQLADTIKGAFKLNSRTVADTNKKVESFRHGTGILGFLKKFGAWIFRTSTFICIYVFGSALTLVVAGVHGIITTAVMILIYILFTITWAVDTIYMKRRYIYADCPVCKVRYRVPAFVCSNPSCGKIHKKLSPGPYGIWHHTCECGQKLPSTFMNGRSGLEAVCPGCGASIAASDAHNIVYQLIGATNSGKTVYLAAFFHQFMQRLHLVGSARVTIPDDFQPYFDDLSSLFEGGPVTSTPDLNSQMYPVLVDSSLETRRQFSIYDIAGEMFNRGDLNSVNIQEHFRYADGFLFLLDPFSSGSLRKQREDHEESLEDFSNVSSVTVINNFVNYLVACGFMKVDGRCNKPIAVIISKADYPEIKREIGPAKISSIYNKNQDAYRDLQDCRDKLCRQFLIDIDMYKVVETLEMTFTNVHYFVASAMGHTYDGDMYTPWGVTDPLEWLLPGTDIEFAGLVMPEVVAKLELSAKTKQKESQAIG